MLRPGPGRCGSRGPGAAAGRADRAPARLGHGPLSAPVGTETSGPARLATPQLRRVLAVLCLTEITSWGIVYYAFPVLAHRITADTGWSGTAITTAFSLALVISALIGVPVGRRLDAVGPRAVMTAGSVVGGLALVMIAGAQSLPMFFAGWAVAGIAMAGTFYAPAFAALTRWYGPDRVRALTTLTLAAGLASTVFAPATAALAEQLSWRQTYLVLAGVLVLVTVPAHAIGLAVPWPSSAVMASTVAEVDEPDTVDPRAVARSAGFVVLAVGMSLAAFGFYAVIVNLVPLLLERGLAPSTAALALGLGGVGQVAGRLGYRQLSERTGLRTRTTVVLLTGAATTALLAAVPGPALVLVAASVLAGVTRGIFTLLQATTVSDRWGIHHYGRLNGVLSAPMTITAAIAPGVGAALAGLFGSYPPVFVVLAALTVVGAALVTAVTPARLSRTGR